MGLKKLEQILKNHPKKSIATVVALEIISYYLCYGAPLSFLPDEKGKAMASYLAGFTVGLITKGMVIAGLGHQINHSRQYLRKGIVETEKYLPGLSKILNYEIF